MPHSFNHRDLKWNAATGQLALKGDLWRLFQGLDQALLKASAEFAAQDYKFPLFIEASQLAKLDYFKSFPHLATFPVCLKDDEDNLTEFAAKDHSATVHFSKLDDVKSVLTPAACYHLYINLRESAVADTGYFTMMCPCFRREKFYEPLQRQWSFSMREIVAVGKAEDVELFMQRAEALAPAFAERLGINFVWTVATDPFFKPHEDPKYFAQVVSPTKKEMIFGDGLSIGSLNNHRTYFGEAFQIRTGSEFVSSSCLAFGLERWIFAILKTHGHDSQHWPKNVKELMQNGV